MLTTARTLCALTVSLMASALACAPQIDGAAQSTLDDDGPDEADADVTSDSDSSSSSSSTTDAETGTDATSMTGFLPDMVPDGGDCLPGIADDCPSGEKCSAYVMEPGYCCVDTNACVPIIGDKQFGDECVRTEMNDDCGNTLFCMTTTSGAIGDGVCLQLCDVTDASYCGNAGLPDASCTPFNQGILPLCESPCDPLAQDCGMGWGCYPVADQGFTCAGPAFDPGGGMDGSDCYTIQSCAPGLACVAGDAQDGCTSESCCTPFCDTSATPSGCSAPEECLEYYESGTAPPGLAAVGLCALPA